LNTPQSATRQIVDLRAEVNRLQAENDQLKKQHDEAIYLMNRASLEFNKAKAQLAATEEALAQVQRESAKLRDEYYWLCSYPGVAAMDVCEAAVAVEIAGDARIHVGAIDQDHDAIVLLYDAQLKAMAALNDAIAKYRGQYEKLRVRFRDLFKPALSPAKQSVFDAAIERLEDEEKLEEMNGTV
jgi:predicted nuclease with TOPRIM domain